MTLPARGLHVRSVHALEELVGLPGDPPDLEERLRPLWDAGRSRPDWAFLLHRGETPIGRMGLRIAPTYTSGGSQGSLPREELFAYALRLPEGPEAPRAASLLLRHALRATAGLVPELLQIPLQAELHPRARAMCDTLLACGLELFEERLGYTWVAGAAPVQVPKRLGFRSLRQVGRRVFAELMGACGEGTLSRNDRYYWVGAGSARWAREMMQTARAEDADLWLVGYARGLPVGYVAVSPRPEWGSTIHHIGVRPDHRGRGYAEDLIRGAPRPPSARESGPCSPTSTCSTCRCEPPCSGPDTGTIPGPGTSGPCAVACTSLRPWPHREPVRAYRGSSTICVQRNMAMSRSRLSLVTTESQTCVRRPR